MDLKENRAQSIGRHPTDTLEIIGEVTVESEKDSVSQIEVVSFMS